MKINVYDVGTFSQSGLNVMFDPSDVHRAFVRINEHLINTGKETIELTIPPDNEIIGVKTSDHQPCGDCGGTFFLRTGTCHVCQTCGQSQGCS